MGDLHLDQLVASVLDRSAHPDHTAQILGDPVADVETIRYRQQIFADLDQPARGESARRLVAQLGQVRRRLATLSRIEDPLQSHGWTLEAAIVYCDAVIGFTTGLETSEPTSRGLRDLAAALRRYCDSPAFARLREDAARAGEAMAAIRYCLHLKGHTVGVSRYEGEADYSQQVTDLFSRFQHEPPHDYRLTYRFPPVLGRVGTDILAQLANLFPEEFDLLDRFCRDHPDFISEQVGQLETELDFFLAYLDHITELRETLHVPFCYPTMGEARGGEAVDDTFDIALAGQLGASGRAVVLNSYRLDRPERIFVVTGPNQGGKTTFARTFGQLHHLAGLGCPIPGSAATIARAGHIYTHFQREEHLTDLRGRLHGDLERIRQILSAADADSVVVINELFSSATLEDARYLGAKIMADLIAIDARGVYVTFIDELARAGPAVVSLTSSADPADPAQRTYKIGRAPADGVAHALALAEKYGLTYPRLGRRLRR